jgi:uncharacterized RDD family membrane protein YckC
VTTPAPGWYPDPGGSGGQRWWDGVRWTDHLAPPPPAPWSSPAIAQAPRPGDPAGFGLRAGAYLLDSFVTQLVVLGLVYGGLALVFGLVWVVLVVTEAGVLGTALLVLSFVVLLGAGIAFTLWYELHAGRRRGQTYGKHLVDVVVVDTATGQPGIGAGRAFLRLLARWLSGAAFGLGFLWALWDPQQRTWHDMLTNTEVRRAPPEANLSPPAFLRNLGVRPGDPLVAPPG